MSKEPIDLGLSVERHVHHDDTDHHHGLINVSDIDQPSTTRRDSRDFATETLSPTEQVLAIIFGGVMMIVILAIVVAAVINIF